MNGFKYNLMKGRYYISPNELAIKSYMLGALVYNSGFKPDFMIALWRGGATIGCYVHELLEHKNVHVDHIAIRTSRQPDVSVIVHTLNYVTNNIKEGSKILIVDDVFDSGNPFPLLLSNSLERVKFPVISWILELLPSFTNRKEILLTASRNIMLKKQMNGLSFPTKWKI